MLSMEWRGLWLAQYRQREECGQSFPTTHSTLKRVELRRAARLLPASPHVTFFLMRQRLHDQDQELQQIKSSNEWQQCVQERLRSLSCLHTSDNASETHGSTRESVPCPTNTAAKWKCFRTIILFISEMKLRFWSHLLEKDSEFQESERIKSVTDG